MEFLHPLPLNYNFGTLDDGLGSFPLATGPYHPMAVCQIVLYGIRSLIKFGTPCDALVYSVLYPRRYSSDALPK